MAFGQAGPLTGLPKVPGDKSISHRALMVAAMAVGRSRIFGLCDGSDVLSTARALRAMGVGIRPAGDAPEAWDVDGVGTGGLLQPEGALDMGNSGTSTRLLMGLVASHPIRVTFIGDASLCRRPMDRAIAPLSRIGADIASSRGGRLPLTVRGLCPAVATFHALTVASAQVKSALIFAALNSPGVTRIEEPFPTRDHSERMLRMFGAEIEVDEASDGPRRIAVRGEADLSARNLTVPRDPSSAAFLVVAALIVPGSRIRVEGVCVNQLRRGLFDLLREMSADLDIMNEREEGNETVADIEARHSKLHGIDVPAALVPAMIDEFPIFFIAAAFAEGISRARDLGELRVKECDRISAMAEGLAAIGACVEETSDGLVIQGSGGAPLTGGATIRSRLDHRVAMSFAVAGLHCREPITVDDMSPVETSFPNFAATLEELAA